MGGDVDGCLFVSLKLGGGARRDVYKRDNIFIQCDSWTSHAPARSYWPSGSGYHILAQLLECHTRSGCANTQQQTRPDTETDPLKGGGGTRARTRSWVRMRTRHCQYVRRATKALPAAWAGLPRLRNDVHCNFSRHCPMSGRNPSRHDVNKQNLAFCSPVELDPGYSLSML